MVPAAWKSSCRETPQHPREMDRRQSLLQLLCSSLQWRHRLQLSGVTVQAPSQSKACLMRTWRKYEAADCIRLQAALSSYSAHFCKQESQDLMG